MKARIFYLTIWLGLTTFIFSCDYIQSPYTQAGPNGCTVSEPVFTPRPNPVRKVLVEDFTGHKCGICPNAHIVLSDLISQHGEQVIGIALHSSLTSGFTGLNPPNTENKFRYDFTSAASTGIDDEFGINTTGLPNGLINRKDFGGSRIVTHTTWSDKVNNILSVPPVMDIQLKNFYNPTENTICSYAYIQALQDLNSSYKLVILLTEDSVINWQKFYGQTPDEIPDYVHNHVLRTSLTLLWGAPVANGQALQDSETFIDGYSISTLGTDWNMDHLHVVAFVYDVDNLEVLQAEQVKVIP